jgi:hypothetical protein
VNTERAIEEVRGGAGRRSDGRNRKV